MASTTASRVPPSPAVRGAPGAIETRTPTSPSGANRSDRSGADWIEWARTWREPAVEPTLALFEEPRRAARFVAEALEDGGRGSSGAEPARTLVVVPSETALELVLQTIEARWLGDDRDGARGAGGALRAADASHPDDAPRRASRALARAGCASPTRSCAKASSSALSPAPRGSTRRPSRSGRAWRPPRFASTTSCARTASASKSSRAPRSRSSTCPTISGRKSSSSRPAFSSPPSRTIAPLWRRSATKTSPRRGGG